MGHRLLFLLLCWVPVAAVPAPALVFNMGFEPGSPQAEFQVRLAQAVFERLGIATGFVRVGAERALVNVDQGIEDGNLVRVAGLEARYPNLVRVDEPMIVYDFVAVVGDEHLIVDGWDGLAGHDVAIVTGWKIVEDNVRRYGSLTRVRNGELLFDLLDAGRVDVVVYERLQAQLIIARSEASQARILSPPLTSRPMYMYLNRRHAGLLPAIERTLRELKGDGGYRELYEDVFGTPPS